MSNKDQVLNELYSMSHIIIATILVVCLKRYNDKILTLLLLVMLVYLSYQEKNNIPIYTLFAIGTAYYLISMLVVRSPFDNEPNKKYIDNLWQIPYWGIVSYYIIMISGYMLVG